MKGAPKQVEKVASGSVTPRLGAGDLGGVAGQEVIHRLRRGQPGDRRHHAEGIAVSMMMFFGWPARPVWRWHWG